MSLSNLSKGFNTFLGKNYILKFIPKKGKFSLNHNHTNKESFYIKEPSIKDYVDLIKKIKIKYRIK